MSAWAAEAEVMAARAAVTEASGEGGKARLARARRMGDRIALKEQRVAFGFRILALDHGSETGRGLPCSLQVGGGAKAAAM